MSENSWPHAPFVLYVEDSDHSIRLVEEAFDEIGARDHLSVLKDGGAALELLAEYSGSESIVVLLDLNLVGLHGFEVLESIREDGTIDDLPVIIFTNSNHDADKQRAVELGATAYREKPNSFGEYVTIAKELLSVSD